MKLTGDDVEKSIDEGRAGVEGRAGLSHAGGTRVHALYPARTARGQHAAAATACHPIRDSASAQVDLAQARLAKALASRTQIDVARRALEAAEKSEQKAAKGIDLSETGYDQIRELELLVKVKERSVGARRTRA